MSKIRKPWRRTSWFLAGLIVNGVYDAFRDAWSPVSPAVGGLVFLGGAVVTCTGYWLAHRHDQEARLVTT